MENLIIVETIASVWSYHLARKDSSKETLCGRTDIMSTLIPINTWGMKSDHIPEKYCEKCSEKAGIRS